MKEVLITSSVLIAALLLLRVIFAKKVRRTWIYGAWMLVALRLLIPIQIGALSFSVLTMAKPLTETVQEFSDSRVLGQNEREAEIQVAKDYIEKDQAAFAPQIQEYIRQEQENGTSAEEIAAALVKTQGESIYMPEKQAQVMEEVQTRTEFVSLGEAAKIVWLVGVAAMAIWFATGNLLLGRSLRKVKKTVECESPIPVCISDAAISPCLVGLFRPAVYLTPESAADETVMRHVLAHELTHYRHGDHIWALVRCICLCIYWFDPLVWVAAWISRRDCELACDEGALRRLGEEERIAYGKSLLRVVSQGALPGRLLLAATTMAETKKQLKERVEYIVKKQKLSIVAAVCMLLVCVILVGCVASGPSDSTAPAEKKPWEISAEAELQIKQDYVEFMSFSNHACTVEDVNMVVISQAESGYALVIGCKCGSIDLNASWDALYGDSAAELLFYMPNGWSLRFCKDGEFRTLDEAFNLRWVNYEQVHTIWDDYHAQFPKAYEKWQQVHGGMEQPPEKDASGLDYEVNADGVTCTVTGMGVCNDTDVVIPEYIDGYQVTAIGGMAFWSRIWITSVTMPDSVVSIGRSAFEDCEQMKSIKLSTSLETIGIHAFKGCKDLETVSLPDSLKIIDGGAFSDCTALTEVTIPGGVTSIPAGAFWNCKKLMILNLPGGITDIGEGAFVNCPELTVIEFDGTITQWQAITQTNAWYDGARECNINCSDGQLIVNQN